MRSISISHISSSLKKRPLMPSLLIVQLSFALALICNMLHLTLIQLKPILLKTGLDEKHLVVVDGIFSSEGVWQKSDVALSENALKTVPGVEYASAIFGLPLLNSSKMVLGLRSEEGNSIHVNAYMGEDLIKTLGLQLTSGRNFSKNDYAEFGIGPGASNSVRSASVQPIIITETLAQRWFGGKDILGSLLTDIDYPDGKFFVIGTVRHLLGDISSEVTGEGADEAVLLPRKIGKTMFYSIAVKTRSQASFKIAESTKKMLISTFGPRLNTGSLEVYEYSDLRDKTFSEQRSALKLFGSIALVVIGLTVVSIMGFSFFWVQQRTRQIGIRRALGARKADVVCQFLLENCLIVAASLPFGLTIAYGGSIFLINYYDLPPLPATYLPFSCVLILALGQLSSLIPAFRAANVPPAVATRSLKLNS